MDKGLQQISPVCGKNGRVLQHNHQLVKCPDPTGAGAVLRATFLVPTVWKEARRTCFSSTVLRQRLGFAWMDIWKTELDYSYDDPNVITNGLGIMTKTFHEQQNLSPDSETGHDKIDSDEDNDQYYMSEEEDE